MGEPLDVGTRVHRGHPGTRLAAVTSIDVIVGVGERAAQERRVQDTVRFEVGDVATVADQQPVVLDTRDALTDEATQVRPGRFAGRVRTLRPLAFMTSTARSTPATIDW